MSTMIASVAIWPNFEFMIFPPCVGTMPPPDNDSMPQILWAWLKLNTDFFISLRLDVQKFVEIVRIVNSKLTNGVNSMDMKKRLDAFADAVIAIILTIMVMELPLRVQGGNLDFVTLAKAVGVYAVSFCFVANIWYQHAMAFNQVVKVTRKIIIWDLILVFFLSLIPAATRAMTMIESNYSVMLYGALYLLVTVVLRSNVRQIVHGRYTERDDMAKMYAAIYGNHNTEMWALIAANIVLAYFYPRIAMVLFIVITVRSFFTISGEEVEMEDATAMTVSGRKRFVDMNLVQKRNFMNTLQRYTKQAMRSGQGMQTSGPEWNQFAKRVEREFAIAPEDLRRWLTRRTAGLASNDHRRQAATGPFGYRQPREHK